MITRFLAAMLVAVSLTKFGEVRANWPTVRFNAQRNAVTPQTLDARSLEPAWTYSDAGLPQPAWYGPAKWDAYSLVTDLHSMRNYDVAYDAIVVGGKCYFATSAEHAVVCLDAKSGEELWRHFAGGPVRIAPSYSNGKLYFGADDGFAYCIDESGNLVWKYSPTAELPREKLRHIVNNGNLIPLWPVRTGVVVDGDTAYFAASLLPWESSYLCAVDAATGQPTGKEHYVRRLEGMTFEGPIGLSRDLLIAPQGRVAPALFARRNGQAMGSLKEGGGGAYVVVVEGEVLHGPGNKSGWMTRSDARTGERLATHPQARAVVVDGDVTYLLTKRMLVALERGKTQPRWMTKVEEPLSMIAAANVLIVGKLDGVEAYDSKTGALVWRGDVNGRAHGLAISDGTLLVSTETGEIAAFHATGESAAVDPQPSDAAVTEAEWTPEPPPPIEDESLLGRWVFQRPFASWLHVQNLVDESFAATATPVDLVRIGQLEAANIAPSGQSFTVAEKFKSFDVPRREFTAEGWVRIDQPQPWGAILGVIQDDGDKEHGWLLGYRDDRFGIAVAGVDGAAGLTYASADRPFTAGRWYHVAGTYDGKTIRLYVDGRLVASSEAQSGDIDYPGEAPMELGAYRDSNENYPLAGAVQEVRLYRRALGEDELSEHYSAKRELFPPPLDLTRPASPPPLEVAIGPWLQFTGPGRAVIRWQTAQPTSTHVELQLEGERQVYSGHPEEKTTQHEIHIDNLLHNRVYAYRILSDAAGEGLASESFECDTFFDYNQPEEFLGPVDEKAARAAESIVDGAKSRAGICLLYACEDVELAVELARHSKYHVHWFVATESAAENGRRKLLARGAAARVHVHSREALDGAWLTPHSASAIVVGVSGEQQPSNEEISRLLSPNGVAWINVSTAGESGTWQRVAGAPLPGSGSWTHAYGKSDNAAFGGEKLAGASGTGQLQVQWLGRPGPRYQSDRGNRNPPPLASNGRLFTQGLDRMIAIDQYNGGVLWSLEIPNMRRYNVPRDCANWCADDDYVYTAVRDKVWKIDAATGDVVHFDVHDKNLNGRGFDWGYVASEGELLIGSAVGSGSSYDEYWGAAMWYDATSGPHAAKVVSDKLFAAAKADGYELWQYQNGLIQNATITIGDGKIVFVESRSGELKQAAARRIDSVKLFQELYLVALDVRTGKRLWEKALEGVDGTTMLCMAATDEHLVLVASHPKQFDLVGFDMNSGDKRWNATVPWPEGRDDHGVHLSRPSMIGDKLFLRPYVFDLATGELHPERIPIGGCGTHACSADALIFRSGSGGMVSMWSPETGQYSHFPRLRPNCWLNVVPAGGLLLAPEAGGGCSCGNWMETSLAFIPASLLEPPVPQSR